MQETTLYIPVGMRFRPTDEELVKFYLHKKVSGTHIPYVDYFVKDCDLYGKLEPGKIWELYGGHLLTEEDDLYFFTQLKKKTPKGSRIDRKVGSGSWQGEDAPKDIISSKTLKIIGSKKRFRYEKEGSEENGCWIMHEYTLHSSSSGQNRSSNYVLCRIRKNHSIENKKKSRLSKKRKLQDFQDNNQFVEPKRVFTKEENKQDVMIDFERREAVGMDCSSVAGVGPVAVLPDHEAMMLQQENESEPLSAISDEDMCLLRKLLEEDPIGESVDCLSEIVSNVAMAFSGQNLMSEIPQLVPEENAVATSAIGESVDWMSEGVSDVAVAFPGQTFVSEISQLAPEENAVATSVIGESVDWMREGVSDVAVAFPGQTLVSEISQLAPEENAVATSVIGESVDWMREGVSDVAVAFPGQTLLSEISQPAPEENAVAPSTTGGGVEWVSLPGMKEMLCDLPKLMSEEYVFVPCDDGEIDRTTSSSVQFITNERSLSDDGCASECTVQTSESVVANIPRTLTAAAVLVGGECGEGTDSMADWVMMEEELSSEYCGVIQQFLFEENQQQEERFYQENFTNLIFV